MSKKTLSLRNVVGLTAVAAAVLMASDPPRVSAQSADAVQTLSTIDQAKRQFAEAAQSVAANLLGLYGDEAIVIRAKLDAMEKALAVWDQAIREFERAAASHRTDPRYRLTLARIYLDRHRSQEAMREGQGLIELEPSRPEGYALLALVHLSESRLEPAASAFASAAERDAADPRHLYRLADMFTALGRTADASSAAQRFHQSVETRLARIWQDRHTASDRSATGSGYPDGLTFALRHAPVDHLAESTASPDRFLLGRYEQATVHFADGKYAEALASLRESTEHDPLFQRDPATDTRLVSASLALREHRLDVAIDHLAAAVKHRPNALEPRRLLGNAYWAKGDLGNATTHYRAALAIAPADERVHLALGSALLTANRWEEGEAALKAAIKAVPRSGRAWYALGRLYQTRGRIAEAVDHYREAIRLRPLAATHAFQGIVASLQAQSSNDAGLQLLQGVIRQSPNSMHRHLHLAEWLLQKGRFDEALSEYHAIALMDPLSTAAYAGMAQLEFRRGRHARAIASARRVLELDRDHMQARYTLGQALMRIGEVEQGRNELEEYRKRQAVAKANEHTNRELVGWRQEAVVHFNNGDYDKAVEFLRKVVEARSNGQAHALLGEALMKAGRHAEAVDALRRATELNWISADVHAQLAEAYKALGRLEDSERERAIAERMRKVPAKGGTP